MANQLIPVFSGEINNQSTQLINARDLHAFLGVGKHFASWITDRIKYYGFVSSTDYIVVSQKREIGKGRGKTEYHLTLDMGKELAMVERNEKGRQARRYFIDCEKRLQQGQVPPVGDRLVVNGVDVRVDVAGRYCLSDLHKASGKIPKHRPHQFLRIKKARNLIKQVESETGLHAVAVEWAVNSYAVKDIVLAYAHWISPLFYSAVIHACGGRAGGQPSLSVGRKQFPKSMRQRFLLTIDSDGTSSCVSVPDDAYIVPPANLKKAVAMELPGYTLVKRKDLIAIHRSFSNLQASIEESVDAWGSIAESTGMDAFNN